MSKEYWVMCYESCVEDLCNEHNLEWDSAESLLLEKLDAEPHYLDGYMGCE